MKAFVQTKNTTLSPFPFVRTVVNTKSSLEEQLAFRTKKTRGSFRYPAHMH